MQKERKLKMEKLPIKKTTLNILYEALKLYQKTGLRDESTEQLSKLFGDWGKGLDDKTMPPEKKLSLMLGMPADLMRARREAFNDIESELDIIIARIQVLRKKMEGKADTTLVENFLEELGEE